jgi:hypothetical protein
LDGRNVAADRAVDLLPLKNMSPLERGYVTSPALAPSVRRGSYSAPSAPYCPNKINKTMADLILKRASVSSPSRRRGNDYAVLQDGVMWVAYVWCRSARELRRVAHGYEATREAAMAAFAKSWRRE